MKPLSLFFSAIFRKLPISLAILAGVSVCWGQTTPPRIRDVNTNSWWVYAGDHPVGKGPWGIYTEVQVRRSDFASTWQQLQFREALTYRFSPNVQVAAGYVYTHTSRYGDFPLALRAFPEHRTYQQLIVKHNLKGRLEFEHRYRTEQRFIQAPLGAANYYRYQSRFRYQLKAVLPISKTDSRGRQWSLFAGDELMINYGPNFGPSPFDQNRAFAGVGYKLSPANKVEVGYLNQLLEQRNGRIEESNHTFRVQWSSSVRLFGGD